MGRIVFVCRRVADADMPRYEVQNLRSVLGLLGLAVVYHTHTSWSRYVLLYHVSNLSGRSKSLIMCLGPNDVVHRVFAHIGLTILQASSLALMNIR